MTQSNYCFDQPKWEAKYTNGIIYGPIPMKYVGSTGIVTTQSCLAILMTKLLAPREKVVLKRKLNLPSGSYTLRSWIGSPGPDLPGTWRLEAPTIIVNIP